VAGENGGVRERAPRRARERVGRVRAQQELW
jgi:hypothetical protein